MEDKEKSDISLERLKKLGFKPQKEIFYNELLPYAEKLDDESKNLFKIIKINLSKAILLREIYPGCAIWSGRLMIYIKLYGLKFSKEDHVALINLLYELLTIPRLEHSLVRKFTQILIMLLKKKYLLSPDDITLDWRPLYDLCKRVVESHHGFSRYYSSYELNLDVLIHSARHYFSETATQEILDELKPQISLLTCNPNAMELLSWFLPVSLPPEKASFGYNLWLSDMMEMWSTCNNCPSWEPQMMRLMADLASHNVGYIDWEPYLPIMFTRFLRSFKLPVYYKQCQSPKIQKIEISAIALWIVSVLDRNSSCQSYLDKFLKTIETYFYPANFGLWFLPLKELFKMLSYYFVQRLQYERYKKLTWETPVPESRKLTEEDIDKFVDSMKGIAMLSIFSKIGCMDPPYGFYYLATLRPKIIVPEVIEKFYLTLESVTEPHKLTSIMNCVTVVARLLVQGVKYDYAEGPTHVISILMSLLPGIDPNDFVKSFVTIQLISVIVTLIPLIDSSNASEYWNDLTKEEEIICAATANFEDFVAQIFDRIFNFIESSSLSQKDNSNPSKVENFSETAFSSVVSCVLFQCSPKIFKMALQKLKTFVTLRIFETKLAGRVVATLCKIFSRVNPEETLKCLLPHFCNTILSLTESEEIQKEEILDGDLHYNLLILSEIVDCYYGISPFIPQLLQVADRILLLSSRESFTIVSKLLDHILLALTTVCLTEKRSLAIPYDSKVEEYLPIRHWGESPKIKDLNLQWHVPGDAERQCVQEIIWKYLPAELERINKHITDEKPLTRAELLRSLYVIYGLLGAHFMLPDWEEQPLTLIDSAIKIEPFIITHGIEGNINLPDGSNVKQAIALTIDKLQKKILAYAEDDTKSLFVLVQIWERLILARGRLQNQFEKSSKNLKTVKKFLGNPLVKKERHIRVILIQRTMLQQEWRIENIKKWPTETHKKIFLNLLELSCSHYSEVRIRAQATLSKALLQFTFSYTILIPQLIKNLEMDSIENHERFKGSLYVLCGVTAIPLIARYDWNILQLWPVLVKTKPSEKPSVVKLLDTLKQIIPKHYRTMTLSIEISKECIEKAKCFLGVEFNSTEGFVSEDEIENGKLKLEEKGKRNEKLYLNLVNCLTDAIEKNNLHWRYYALAMCFVLNLAHPDVPYPSRTVKLFLEALIHDSLELRKMATKGTLFLLIQQKRKQKRIAVDIEKVVGFSLPEKLTPGIRPDNMWLQYNSDKLPKSVKDWDEPRYVIKPATGYFQWPKQLEMYCPYSEQPQLDRKITELSPEEKEVHDFFTNTENVNQIIRYFSLEEKKGKDKFNEVKFWMFKQLFSNQGDSFLHLFKSHLETLILDSHESSQRCAAEILGGLIRGSKHWPYEKVSSLWEFLGPLIKKALSNLTDETVQDWGTCFSIAVENMHPSRNHWLLEILMEKPFAEKFSFVGCGRLYILHCVLNKFGWKVSELHKRLLKYFEPFLDDPLQIVRERIASTLTTIFLSDIKFPGGTTLGPHPEDFIQFVIPKLEILYSFTVANNFSRLEENQTDHVDIKNLGHMLKKLNFHNGEESSAAEKETSIRLLKTVCNWIIGTLTRAHRCILPQFYFIFPLICSLESYDQDEELVKLCSMTLNVIGLSAISPEHIPVVLESIETVAQSDSWLTRSSIVVFLQVFIFHNMPLILSNSKWKSLCLDFVLKLLEDVRVEVREKAAYLLGGLIHCDFINNKDELLTSFKKKAKTKIDQDLKNQNPNKIRLRHSGILGLCSFIDSSPYNVPDYVPEIFLILGKHLNDPHPIPSTIRRTLGNFKRTHHDNWVRHKLKFTENQLEVLTDINVTRSYFA